LKCFKCEAEIPGDSRFCLSCGEKLQNYNKKNVQSLLENNRKKFDYLLFSFVFINIIMGFVLAIIIVVLLI